MSFGSPVSRRKFLGLVTRRERWGLSWRGYAIVLLVALLAFAVWVRGVYPFFAVTERVPTRLLVVEGWVDVNAIAAAVEEFKAGGYDRILTTGGPVQGMGGYTNDYNTSASVGAGRLRTAGMPDHLVQMVPSRVSARDRTYSAAVALREWCEQHHVPLQTVNVLTKDVHARRTRLLFEAALGDGVKVGIIAVPNADYDARQWWRYSEGVRSVLGECIAYAYARLIFRPERNEPTVASRKSSA